MKTFLLLISLSFYCTSCMVPQQTYAQESNVSFQVFYDELSPYGTWINNPEYGYVWYPRAGSDFSPYSSNGYWVLTDMGWTWVSNYSWGWAPFHYGRWFMDPVYGNMWLPGNQWGPGWVDWRRSGGYYGWAPMGPGQGGHTPYNHWNFVRNDHLGRKHIDRFYAPRGNNQGIYNSSSEINNIREDRWHNTSYNYGPDRNEVEKARGKKFAPVSVVNRNKPGQDLNKKQMNIYKPSVQPGKDNKPRSAPNNPKDRNKEKMPIQSPIIKPVPTRPNSPEPRKEQAKPAPARTEDRRPVPASPQQPRKEPARPEERKPDPVRPAPQPRQEPARPEERKPDPVRPAPQPRQEPVRAPQPRSQPSRPPQSKPGRGSAQRVGATKNKQKSPRQAKRVSTLPAKEGEAMPK